MNVQCTKKLLDKLEIEPDGIVNQINFFDWHANLIQFNNRDTIVFTNNLFRYSIVLYNVKAVDNKQINRLFRKSLIEIFHGENIDQRAIDRYILQAGQMHFTKTSNRSVLSSMNQIWRELPFFAEEVDHNEVIQTDFNLFCGTRIDICKEDFYSPQELLVTAMKLFQTDGETGITLEHLMKIKPSARKAIILNIKIFHNDQIIWRMVATPFSYTFEQVHRLIQIIFNWRNEQSHQFEIIDDETNPVALSKGSSHDKFGYEEQLELFSEKKRIYPFLQHHAVIRYRYGFADNWIHTIELVDTIDEMEGVLPVCLDGVGDGAPEDSCWVEDYRIYLPFIENMIEDDNYEALFSWKRDQKWHPFDLKIINRRLSYGAY